MRLLELGKDLKIKHSVSSPPYKTWRIFFWKKALHGGTNFLWQIHGGIFYMGIIDQIMQGQGGGVELLVKRFQWSSQATFPLIDPDLGY